jgi:hypothetical protein
LITEKTKSKYTRSDFNAKPVSEVKRNKCFINDSKKDSIFRIYKKLLKCEFFAKS